MKRYIALAALVLLSVTAQAALVATNAINLQSVATTTVIGLTNTITSVALPQRTYLIQNTGITGPATGTNALNVNAQWSVDGVNWTTFATYIPSRTNATVDTYAPSMNALTVYTRLTAVTTNTVTVGVTELRN